MIIGWKMAAAMLAVAGAAFPQAAMAQSDNCSDAGLNAQPTREAMLAYARSCADRGFSSSLAKAGDLIAQGFRGAPPDWRLAASVYDEVVNRTEPLPYSSMGARIWGGTLQRLAEKFEDGSVELGWPQDYERALQYRTRMLARLLREPTATPDEIAYARDRLKDSTTLRDYALQRSGRWTGDIPALSRINRFAVRDNDIGAARLEASRFVGVISEIEPIEVDPGDDPRYVIRAQIYLPQPLPGIVKGVCLVLANNDESWAKPGRRVGIFFQSLSVGQQYPVSSGPFQGRYRLVSTQSYVPIQWSPGVVPRNVYYEFRPVIDKALCPADM